MSRVARQTMAFACPPVISAWACIAGKKEGEGPLGKTFDRLLDDDIMGEKSWEKAECKMFQDTIKLCIEKTDKKMQEIDLLIGGDLLNQIITVSFAARDLELPLLGQYGACSTMAQSLLLASSMLDGAQIDNALCVTSSHFSTAERQYRFPLELGNQRTPTAQWTVTGSGCAFLERQGTGPRVCAATFGSVIDMGITDAANMGAAMAPSALDTLQKHLQNRKQSIRDYDFIVTGDLGLYGSELLVHLAKKEDLQLSNHYDCGCEIFYVKEQDTHAGGSGCGCSAVVLCGKLLPAIASGEIRRILFMATGALLSPTTTLQGESIPGITHAVEIIAEGVTP